MEERDTSFINMNQENIGNLIKTLRKEKNLTQKELADLLGVTYQAVSKWENGKNIPDIAILKKISDEFSIDINEILNGTNTKKEKKKKKILLTVILLISILTIGALCIFLWNHQDSFQFKKINTTYNGFNITGSIAYNKSQTYIYISQIDYNGQKDTTNYSHITCTLYEEYQDTSTKIEDCTEAGENTTIEEHLKTVKFNIDNYKPNCNDLTKSTLYLEINVRNEEENKTYKIPLTLEELCPTE